MDRILLFVCKSCCNVTLNQYVLAWPRSRPTSSLSTVATVWRSKGVRWMARKYVKYYNLKEAVSVVVIWHIHRSAGEGQFRAEFRVVVCWFYSPEAEHEWMDGWKGCKIMRGAVEEWNLNNTHRRSDACQSINKIPRIDVGMLLGNWVGAVSFIKPHHQTTRSTQLQSIPIQSADFKRWRTNCGLLNAWMSCCFCRCCCRLLWMVGAGGINLRVQYDLHCMPSWSPPAQCWIANWTGPDWHWSMMPLLLL